MEEHLLFLDLFLDLIDELWTQLYGILSCLLKLWWERLGVLYLLRSVQTIIELTILLEFFVFSVVPSFILL